jgi:beta-glucosidase-like glycosyl hydrolase
LGFNNSILDCKVTPDDVNLAYVGSDDVMSLKMARESIILIQNTNNTLPLLDTPGAPPLKVLVTGPTAASLPYQTGSWTWGWHVRQWFTRGSTMLDALLADTGLNATFRCGVDINGNNCNDTEAALQSLTPIITNPTSDSLTDAYLDVLNSDVIVVCIGKAPSTGYPLSRQYCGPRTSC